MTLSIDKYIVNNTLKIFVKPGSSANQVIGYINGTLKVAITAPAERDKANREVIKYFSHILGRKVRIVYGLHSKVKVLRIM
jgi:uncharacterized protein (TIGR00251 family)